jgi:predicted nuclease of predicted toxin-antitoxin system
MKVLLDSCVSENIRPSLTAAGHDVAWTGDWESDTGDEEILAFANREGCVLVTLDKDFGTLAILYGRPHAGIVRLVNLSLREQTAVCLHILQTYATDLTAGAIITAELNRVRIRLPD